MTFRLTKSERAAAIIEAVKLAPAIRRMMSEAETAWEEVTDPRTPRWRSAVFLIAGIQAVGMLPLELPVVLAIRAALIKGFLEARDQRLSREEILERIDRVIEDPTERPDPPTEP